MRLCNGLQAATAIHQTPMALQTLTLTLTLTLTQAVTAIHQTPMALQTLALLTPMLLDLSTSPKHDLASSAPSASSAAAGGSAGVVLPSRAVVSGPRVMHEALQLALPGIDANDLDKMASTLRFIQQVATATLALTLTLTLTSRWRRRCAPHSSWPP